MLFLISIFKDHFAHDAIWFENVKFWIYKVLNQPTSRSNFIAVQIVPQFFINYLSQNFIKWKLYDDKHVIS